MTITRRAFLTRSLTGATAAALTAGAARSATSDGLTPDQIMRIHDAALATMGEQAYRTWFERVGLDVVDSTLILITPAFQLVHQSLSVPAWIEENYGRDILASAQSVRPDIRGLKCTDRLRPPY